MEEENDKIESTASPELEAELEAEIEEELSFAVNSGFYEREDLAFFVHDIFADYQLPPPQDGYIDSLIERIKSTAATPCTDNYIRLRNVFDALNKERIIAIHFAGYTLDDGFAEVGEVFNFMKENNIPRRGYCFYHQQDIQRAMDTSIQSLYLAFHSTDGDTDAALEVGERVTELLIEHGFSVEWDKSVDSRILIKDFEWDKTYDGEDYGADRAIRLMSTLLETR